MSTTVPQELIALLQPVKRKGVRITVDRHNPAIRTSGRFIQGHLI